MPADAPAAHGALTCHDLTSPMTDSTEDLVLDLLEWMGSSPRPYAEVLEAWRTACPRLTVWEDANERGYLERHYEPGRGRLISVSGAGADHLHRHRGDASGPG